MQLVPRQNAVYSNEPREIEADVETYSAQSKKHKYDRVLIRTATVKSVLVTSVVCGSHDSAQPVELMTYVIANSFTD